MEIAAAPVIGFLHPGKRENFARQIEELRDSIEEQGYDLPKEARLDFRFANGSEAQLATDAKSLMENANVQVIIAAGPKAAQVAKSARPAGPIENAKWIVFTTIVEPNNVLGIPLNQLPANRITGMAGLTSELDIERLRLLREILPAGQRRIGVLRRAGRAQEANFYRKLDDAATQTMDFQLSPVSIDDTSDYVQQITVAFTGFRAANADAVLVTADPLFNDLRKDIVGLAKGGGGVQGLPAIYQWREFVAAGGLMSYGPTLKEAYRHAGACVARILDGFGPGVDPANEVPVTYPSEFELVINTRRAAQLPSVSIPVTMAARAILLPRRRR